MEIIERNDIEILTQAGNNKPRSIFDKRITSLQPQRYLFTDKDGKGHSFEIQSVFRNSSLMKSLLETITKTFGNPFADCISEFMVSNIHVGEKVIVVIGLKYNSKLINNPVNKTFQIELNEKELSSFLSPIDPIFRFDWIIRSDPLSNENTTVFLARDRRAIFSLIYQALYTNRDITIVNQQPMMDIITFLDNVNDNQLNNNEIKDIITNDIIYNNGIVEIPILERMDDIWIFYKDNYNKYRDKIDK